MSSVWEHAVSWQGGEGLRGRVEGGYQLQFTKYRMYFQIKSKHMNFKHVAALFLVRGRYGEKYIIATSYTSKCMLHQSNTVDRHRAVYRTTFLKYSKFTFCRLHWDLFFRTLGCHATAQGTRDSTVTQGNNTRLKECDQRYYVSRR